MKRLSESAALTLLQRSKAAYKRDIKINYEHAAQDCRTCLTPGACCTDAHFVNVHITRLEAVAMRETLERTPRLDDGARRRIYARAHRAVERYGLRVTHNETGFRQTFSCPLFEPNVGCVVHARAKPAPCIQHACYENWEDLPPVEMQWRTEHNIEALNTRVYQTAWAWLSVPVWLTLVDPHGDSSELARLETVWRTRRASPSEHSDECGNAAYRRRTERRRLPVLFRA